MRSTNAVLAFPKVEAPPAPGSPQGHGQADHLLAEQFEFVPQ
jgi:hypothetical protein